MVVLPFFSALVSSFYPAALGFNDGIQGSISEIRVTWLVSVARDVASFLILFMLALIVEGCKSGCGRLLTAGWTSPASPVIHVATAVVLGTLVLGWQTMFLLGTQFIMPPTQTQSPDAKHHLFISSSLGLVPILYILLATIFGCCTQNIFSKDSRNGDYSSGGDGGGGGGSGGGSGGGGSGTTKSYGSTTISRSSKRKSTTCCSIKNVLVVLGLSIISASCLTNVITSFNRLDTPCYTNVTTNVTHFSVVGGKSQSYSDVVALSPSSPSSSSSVSPLFSSTCLKEGFILLCCSSLCLAAYVSMLTTRIYDVPKRQFRPLSTSAWSAGFAAIGSVIVLLFGTSSVENGFVDMFHNLPPLDDMLLYGVLPGVVSVVGSYLMLAWLVLNVNGDVASSLYGLPLVFSVIACEVGFKWENKGTLQWTGFLYAGLSLFGIGMVLSVRLLDWCGNGVFVSDSARTITKVEETAKTSLLRSENMA